jgi:hypothetical protein
VFDHRSEDVLLNRGRGARVLVGVDPDRPLPGTLGRNGLEDPAA